MCIRDRLRAVPDRTFAALGNHDYESLDEVRDGLAANDVTLLVDEARVLETRSGPVQILGADYVRRGRRKHLEELIADHPRLPDHTRILLLHDPLGFRHVPVGGVDPSLENGPPKPHCYQQNTKILDPQTASVLCPCTEANLLCFSCAPRPSSSDGPQLDMRDSSLMRSADFRLSLHPTSRKGLTRMRATLKVGNRETSTNLLYQRPITNVPTSYSYRLRMPQ